MRELRSWLGWPNSKVAVWDCGWGLVLLLVLVLVLGLGLGQAQKLRFGGGWGRCDLDGGLGDFDGLLSLL